MKFVISTLVIVLSLTACTTPKPLVVTGKDFVFPQLNSEWLEPCQAPKIPVDLTLKGDFTSNVKLMLYVTDLIAAIDKCNSKIQSTKTVYNKFLKDLDEQAKSNPKPNTR